MRPALIILAISGFLAQPVFPLAPPALAFELSGTKQLALEMKEGGSIPIGSVTFAPKDGKTGFTVDVDTSKFKTFFLSMRDFKCLEGPELECYVPYPYPTPGTVSADDLTWLAHSLIFFYKSKTALGAPLANGLYYDLKMSDHGIEGAPQQIDLNAIASPPTNPNVPPYAKETRDPFEDNARWIVKLTITDPPKS